MARRAKQAGAGGDFVRVKDGESVVGAFVGEPYERELHWTGQASQECGGAAEGCEYCARGERPTLKVALNFWVLRENGGDMRIFELGMRAIQQVVKLRDKFPLDRHLFEISRQGEGMRTTYTILPERELSPHERARMADAHKHDLADVFGRIQAKQGTTGSAARADDDVPF